MIDLQKLADAARAVLAEHPGTNVVVYHHRDRADDAYAILEAFQAAGYSVNVSPLISVREHRGAVRDAGTLVADLPEGPAHSVAIALTDGGIGTGASVKRLEKVGAGRYVGEAEVLVELWP